MPSLRLVICGAMLCVVHFGCVSRAIREGAGVVRGAAGIVVTLRTSSSLTDYRSLRVASITVAEGLEAPDDIASLVSEQFLEAAQEVDLKAAGNPTLIVTGEIIHYETGKTVSHAIGPLQEIIVRTQLIDESSNDVLGEANLVGRSKATSSSGSKNLAEGAGRALKKWLKKAGRSGD